MKTFLSTIPNRFKAAYLAWGLLHLILYVISGNFLIFSSRYMESSSALEFFYPLDYKSRFKFRLEYYDYSDFLLYLIALKNQIGS